MANLGELTHFLGVTDKEIKKHVNELFGYGAAESHDSRYDVVAVYLCYKKAIKKKLIPKDKEAAAKYLDEHVKAYPFNIHRYSRGYIYPENKIINSVIKRCFPDVKSMWEVSDCKICFTADNITYDAVLNWDGGIVVTSNQYKVNDKVNGIHKQEIYKIPPRYLIDAVENDLDKLGLLLLFRDICLWIDGRNRKAAYISDIPKHLKFLLGNDYLKKKIKELELIFYGSGWGWRLRKNWDINLQREFEKIIKE